MLWEQLGWLVFRSWSRCEKVFSWCTDVFNRHAQQMQCTWMMKNIFGNCWLCKKFCIGDLEHGAHNLLNQALGQDENSSVFWMYRIIYLDQNENSWGSLLPSGFPIYSSLYNILSNVPTMCIYFCLQCFPYDCAPVHLHADVPSFLPGYSALGASANTSYYLLLFD